MNSKKQKKTSVILKKEDRAFCENQIKLAMLYYGADVCLPLCHGLTGIDCHDPELQRVIDKAIQLKQAGRPADGAAIAEAAQVSGDTLDKVATFSPIPEHCEHYAQRVKSFSQCDMMGRQVMPLLLDGDAKGAQSVFAELLPSLSASEPSALQVNEWFNQPDETEEPAFHDCFDKGDRVALVAQSKNRKSYFVAQAGICFASGRDFLGVKVSKQKTLIVNCEIKPQKYKHRLRGIARRLGISAGELSLLSVMNIRESGQDVTLHSIFMKCVSGGFDVCIIDPIYNFLGNEIDQETVKAVITELKRFAEKKITLVSVFHSAKGNIGDRQTIDRISGSAIFARDADAIISLASHEDCQSVVMEMILRNYPEQPKKTIVFDDGAFILSDVAPVEKTSRSKPMRKFDLPSVAEAIEGRIQYKDLLNKIMACQCVGRNKAVQLVGDIVTSGLVTTETIGRCTYYSKRETV